MILQLLSASNAYRVRTGDVLLLEVGVRVVARDGGGDVVAFYGGYPVEVFEPWHGALVACNAAGVTVVEPA